MCISSRNWCATRCLLTAESMNNKQNPVVFSDMLSEEPDPGIARGLANDAFTSEAFLDLERQNLFPKCWMFAGRASQLPGSGDREPVEIAGQPLVMVRDGRNRIRVFHNVCPHRGSRIVPCSSKGDRTISCPYHRWTFNLDGSLLARPHFHGPDAHDTATAASCDPTDRPRLSEVRCAQWFDWVFVNLDGQAAPFEQVYRPAMERLALYPLSQFTFDAVESFEFESNWKLVAENWIDMYHIFSVHPDLDDFMVPGSRCGMSVDEAFTYNQYSMTRSSRAHGLVPAKGVEEVQGLVTFGLLFPAVGITVDSTNVLIASFSPLAADRTRMDMLFYFPEEVTDSDEYKDARQQYRDWWIGLNNEDQAVCRLLQLGRQSPAYDGGRFAPNWDQATLHFQRSIIRHLGDQR